MFLNDDRVPRGRMLVSFGTSFCLEDGHCLFVLGIPALVQFDCYNHILIIGPR